MDEGTNERRFPVFLAALAARQPSPGGGAAAALAAALGAAAGAMAARYTTGATWAAVSAEAEALAQSLDASLVEAQRLADEDAAAFAAYQAAKTAKDAAALAAATARSLAAPWWLLQLCSTQAQALAAFFPRCNPRLRSDVAVGVHLLAGAGRAAWQTLLVNQPDATLTAQARVCLAQLSAAETQVTASC